MSLHKLKWKTLALSVTLLLAMVLVSTPTVYGGTMHSSSKSEPDIDESQPKPGFEGGSPVTTPLPIYERNNEVSAASPDALTINIWYGDTQRFGHNGEPIVWVNVQGNISPAASIASASYKLNNGPPVALDIGPHTVDKPRRLYGTGDFNVEIAYSALDPNAVNTVVISATDTGGATVSRTVSLTYTADMTWPMPTVSRWKGEIEDEAQVIDGHWTIEDGMLRTIQVGYDRLVAIGDITWGDMEVTVPVTLHSIDDPDGFANPSFGPGLGLILHWQGHYRWAEDLQLTNGWQRFGAIAWYRWTKSQGQISNGLQMLGYAGGSAIDSDNSKQLPAEVPYMLKMQSEAGVSGCAQRYYRFKTWPEGTAEPAGWDMEACGKVGERSNGSAVLVAHHVDASFGPVTVTTLNAGRPKLTTTPNGPGTVQALPSHPDYTYLQEVELQAMPANGAVFTGWTGDITSTENPYAFTITADTDVVANFVEATHSIDVEVVGNGEVDIDPDLDVYDHGQSVTLTATADTGWRFDRWSGSISSAASTYQFNISQDEAITATFAREYYSLDMDIIDDTGASMPQAGTVDVTAPADPTGYVYEETAVLTPQPSPGWSFQRWEGDITGNASPATHQFMADANVDAVFSLDQYTLDRLKDGEGVITASPAKPYIYGTEVTVEAVNTVTGWEFDRWSGAYVGTENPVTLTVNSNMTITAHFVQDLVELEIVPIGQGDVATDPAGPFFEPGTVVDLIATAESGWKFDAWSGAATGSGPAVSITMDEDKSVTAWFSEDDRLFLPIVAGE